MHEENLTALTAGLLSSSFYYVYTTMQIPVGILFDRYNTRILLTTNAILCALGCFLFASGHDLPTLFAGRLIIGAGSSFAFVGLSHLLRNHFPLKQYAFMIGLSETLGFTLTVFGMIGMGTFISDLGWRMFITGAGLLGFIIAFLCWSFIPNNKPVLKEDHNFKKQFMQILKNKLAWINGLFVCLEFSVITVFGAMWAVPFLQLKLNCDIKTASIVSSMILLGAGLSCPLLGQISIHSSKRRPILYLSCMITAILFTTMLYIPTQNAAIMGSILFMIGLSCGAYMLAYTIANELAPAESLSTCTGFTNTLAMLSAPLLQPLTGYLLDLLSGDLKPNLQDYQTALWIIPAALITAAILSLYLPEKAKH